MTEQHTRWVSPLPAGGTADAPLDPERVEQWRTQGFTLVDSLLPDDLIASAHADARADYPPPNSAEAETMNQFGSKTNFVFPTSSAAANAITLHPNIIRACAQLLDVPPSELRLSQSDVWPKYGHDDAAAPRDRGERDNQDQRIHVDYPNHTLVHPTPWHRPEGVEIIIYYDDVETCAGPTAVVPRLGDNDPAYPWPIVQSPGIGGLDYVNSRGPAEAYLGERAPEFARFRERHLYPREMLTRFRPGSVLLYRHDTWHRGTPMHPNSLRVVQNITYRLARSEWYGVIHPGWNWAMYRKGRPLERLIAGATTEQRTVLGFPPPESDYWCPATIAAVEARYAGLGLDLDDVKHHVASRAEV